MPELAYRIDLASVRSVSATCKAVPLAEAPEDLFQRMMAAKKEMLENDYSQLPEISRNPTYSKYASIVVNGKVVAEIDNHGFVTTSNSMAGPCSDAIKAADMRAGVSSGPMLAQARAEHIAEAVNGSIVMAQTAMSQSAFDAVPQPQVTIDYEAMRRDPRYAEIEQLQKAHAAFLAQQLAHNDAVA
ncbi:MAG: hypothetical protein AAGU21_03120 [Solidesulfovibrio sp.]|uniref:hypothetical protein n=1 Tax=Solidesulfovibrio sp. TaxID=2910990 RepID=UPI002B1FF102|nr:hypothetical protein [Solidesulfovibrio sp.]MEA4856650.1 hypothetical protein [Solidesulfovibrio sp.]